MKEQKYKLIVWDLDGTLYDLNDVLKDTYDIQVEFLSKRLNKSNKEVETFLKKNQINPILTKESKSATEFFFQLGISKQEWINYREERFNVYKINKCKAVDELTLKSFSQFGKLILLSSNSYRNINKILNHISISPSIFKQIICSDKFPYTESFTKKKAFEFLREKYSIQYNNILSIGDRYLTDIKPLIELGGEGVLLNSPMSIKSLLIDLKKQKLCTNEEYSFYENK